MFENDVNILLVDDDDADRRGLTRVVQKEGLPYRITTAKNSTEAAAALTTRVFDLVLLDYDLGDGTGLDLIPDLGDIPVVLVTGHGSEEVAVRAFRAGVCDYIIKDVQGVYLRILPETINAVLARRRAEEERERLLRELQEAHTTIKTLRGLIPICSSCKKVRNDEGVWQTIEVYIQAALGSRLHARAVSGLL